MFWLVLYHSHEPLHWWYPETAKTSSSHAWVVLFALKKVAMLPRPLFLERSDSFSWLYSCETLMEEQCLVVVRLWDVFCYINLLFKKRETEKLISATTMLNLSLLFFFFFFFSIAASHAFCFFIQAPVPGIPAWFEHFRLYCKKKLVLAFLCWE